LEQRIEALGAVAAAAVRLGECDRAGILTDHVEEIARSIAGPPIAGTGSKPGSVDGVGLS
jgi:hypothetical protein